MNGNYNLRSAATAFLVMLLVVGGGWRSRGAAPEKPNVIVFLMDDLGWNDLGYTGSKFYESPNIDRLSTIGVVFTRAYAAPICSPSRASILTGLDPARTGFTSPRGGDPLEVIKPYVQPRIYSPEELKNNWRNLPGGMGAPPNQRALAVVSASRLSTDYPSIAKTFKANGYRTGHFGKWHLGPVPYSPLEHGFDVDVPHINSPGPIRPGHLGPWPDWEGEGGPQNKGRNIDDCLADHAIQFIRENKNRPFYMNFWSYGVHVPIQARKEIIEYFKARAPKTGQNNPVYAAMIKSTDLAFGKVWKAVEEAGLADKTVLLFYSDNGGVNYGTPQITDNSPLRGGKGDVWEGGVRVPGFIIWPGVTKAGARCDLPINTRDVFPTLADICQLKDQPKSDGRSLAPALAGGTMEEKPIFTYCPYYAGGWGKGNAPVTTVAFQGWKLHRYFFDGPGQTHRYELYNLNEDPGESLDYHRQRPELVAKLDKLITDFLKETGAVLPQPNPAYKGAVKGEFEGLTYELLDPVVKRGKQFPLIVCLGADGNPAYEQLHKTAIQNKHAAFLLTLKYASAGEGTARADKVAALIRKVVAENPVQSRMVYVTGQGQGAVGVWELVGRHPELFAAALPVNGTAALPAQVAALKELPVWAFTGSHEPAAAALRQTVEALKTVGSTVARLTEYSDHEPVRLDGVWDNPEVTDWLFQQVSPLPRKPTKTVMMGQPGIGPKGESHSASFGVQWLEEEDDYDPDVPLRDWGRVETMLIGRNE